MKNAVVTGTSSGIGEAIAHLLLNADYQVIGIARRIPTDLNKHMFYDHFSCDLTDSKSRSNTIAAILKKYPEIDVLINCAGIGVFGPHESLSIEQLETMVRLNLEAPLILCRNFLRALKATDGHIINISSYSAKKEATHGCGYAATKAGLYHFSTSLFEEVRKSGVSVTVITPDLTRSAFYDDADFEPDATFPAAILPEQVAQSVIFALNSKPNMTLTELTLRPQVNRIHRKIKSNRPKTAEEKTT